MDTSVNAQTEFYQQIGQLFYAIAASDKVVRKAEYDALKNLVSEEWTGLDDYKDKFGVEAAYQIEIVFDWFDYESLDANDCFETFSRFFREHPSQFTSDRKKLIWRTANAIANSFSGKNKSELMMLAKLHLLFTQDS